MVELLSQITLAAVALMLLLGVWRQFVLIGKRGELLDRLAVWHVAGPADGLVQLRTALLHKVLPIGGEARVVTGWLGRARGIAVERPRRGRAQGWLLGGVWCCSGWKSQRQARQALLVASEQQRWQPRSAVRKRWLNWHWPAQGFVGWSWWFPSRVWGGRKDLRRRAKATWT